MSVPVRVNSDERHRRPAPQGAAKIRVAIAGANHHDKILLKSR